MYQKNGVCDLLQYFMNQVVRIVFHRHKVLKMIKIIIMIKYNDILS